MDIIFPFLMVGFLIWVVFGSTYFIDNFLLHYYEIKHKWKLFILSLVYGPFAVLFCLIWIVCGSNRTSDPEHISIRDRILNWLLK